MFRTHIIAGLFMLSSACAAFGQTTVSALSAPSAFGQCDSNYYWDNGYGSWLAPDNWYHEVWDPDLEECVDDDTIPGGADWARVWWGHPYISGVGATCDWLDLDSSLDLLPGGSLSRRLESIDGSFIQTGGTNTVTEGVDLGVSAGSHGTYELSGGTIESGWVAVGCEGTGVFNQTGGRHTLTGGGLGHALAIGSQPGSDGRYELAGDAELFVTTGTNVGEGGEGAFIQTGGTHSVAEYMQLALSTGSSGTYDLSSGTLLSYGMTVAYEGTGVFRQSGGTVACDSGLVLGVMPTSQGTYELSHGDLSAGNETIGHQGTAIFSQTGGTNTVANCCFMVGDQPGSDGTYELYDGELLVGDSAVGAAGTGSFILFGDLLSGGTIVCDGTVHVGQMPSGVGWFVQTGGTITVR